MSCVKSRIIGEGRIKITHQSKPRKDQIESLIEHFHVDPEFTCKGMGATIDETKLDRTVNRGEEGSIQPSTTLTDQFRNLVGNVSDGVGRFHVMQDPRPATFGHKLPTENLIDPELAS